jgi:alpha-beta hydrolase superfamily lysophospholipase
MASSFTLPVFAFCGSADPIASPQATRSFFEDLPSPDKKFKEYPGMVHEPLNDVGKEEVWKDTSNWISKRL